MIGPAKEREKQTHTQNAQERSTPRERERERRERARETDRDRDSYREREREKETGIAMKLMRAALPAAVQSKTMQQQQFVYTRASDRHPVVVQPLVGSNHRHEVRGIGDGSSDTGLDLRCL